MQYKNTETNEQQQKEDKAVTWPSNSLCTYMSPWMWKAWSITTTTAIFWVTVIKSKISNRKSEWDFGAAGSALDWRSIGPWFESEKSQSFLFCFFFFLFFLCYLMLLCEVLTATISFVCIFICDAYTHCIFLKLFTFPHFQKSQVLFWNIIKTATTTKAASDCCSFMCFATVWASQSIWQY